MSSARAPGRAIGASASHEARKKNNKEKKAAAAGARDGATKASNSAIAATGAVAGARSEFSRDRFTALPVPASDGSLVGKIVAVIFRESDGSYGPDAWMLGKVSSVKHKLSHDVGGNGGVLAAAKKAKYQWKSTEVARGSEWDLECDKYFRGLGYGKLWVLYSEDASTKSAKAKAKVARAKAKASAKAKAKAKATTKASGGATVAPDSATVAADPPTKRARKETQQMKESKAQSSNKKARCK